MGLCDDDASRLWGAVCAAYGIADALFAAAVEGTTITPAHTGLRWALEEAEAVVAELSEKLREAHRLARGA